MDRKLEKKVAQRLFRKKKKKCWETWKDQWTEVDRSFLAWHFYLHFIATVPKQSAKGFLLSYQI